MIIPILHRILVKQDDFDDTDETRVRAKKSGIIIAQVEETRFAQASVDTGTIVAMGETAYRDFNTDSPIKVGDRVAFAKYSGKVIQDPTTKEDFVALNDEDVVAILKE